MARQKGNSGMFNTRGMFNRQVVFKVRGGRVNVSGPPNTNDNRVPTNPQQVYARSVCVSSRRTISSHVHRTHGGNDHDSCLTPKSWDPKRA